MTSLCSPFVFGPLANDFISLCTGDLLLVCLNTFILLVFGLARACQTKSLKAVTRPYTYSHLFEVVASLIVILTTTSNLIYLVVITQGNVPTFKYFSTLGLSVLWMGALALTEYEYRRGVKHSLSIVMFWVISGTFGGIRIQALVQEDMLYNPLGSAPFIIIEVTMGVLLSLNALGYNSLPPTLDEYDDEEEILFDEKTTLVLEKQRKGSEDVSMGRPEVVPEINAPYYSRALFTWLTPLLRKGFYTSIIHDDLPPVREDDDIINNSFQFEKNWKNQLKNEDGPSLFKALCWTFWKPFIIAFIFRFIGDGCGFAGPLLLEQVVLFIQEPYRPLWEGILFAMFMSLGSTIQSLCNQQCLQITSRMGMVTKGVLTSMVYSKSLKISVSARQKSTVGQIINYQSVDASAIGGVCQWLHHLWSTPTQILIALGLLWKVLGVASIGGLAVLLLTIPLQTMVGKFVALNQRMVLEKQDQRMKIINEALQSIRLIKFFGWEFSFSNRISNIRQMELGKVRNRSFIRAIVVLIANLTPVLVNLGSFGIYIAMGNTLTASIAFSALALFNMMRQPLLMFPNVVTQVMEARVSISRLEKFFNLPEIDNNAIEQDPSSPYAVSIKGGTFHWEEGKTILHDINIDVPRGALVAIVGEVGSGKSSLLQALLGEMPKSSGQVIVNGSTAYVPQTAWVKNDTLRDNVLFLDPYEKLKYKSALQTCQLKPDLEILPAKDKTEIGEKGINLSGGQKQRVSMARAVYSDRDIYLLDDPLSAVDARVGGALFRECFRGVLAEKTRILVTHQLQHVRSCDFIYVLSEGRVAARGTYEELVRAGGDFGEILDKHVNPHGEEENPESGNTNPEEEKKKQPDSLEKSSREKNKKKKMESAKLMETEKKNAGGVKSKIYWQYIKSMGGPLVVAGVLLLFIGETAATLLGNYWLSYWSVVTQTPDGNSTVAFRTDPFATVRTDSFEVVPVGRQLAEFGFGSVKIFDELGLGQFFYLMVYGLLGLCTGIMILLRSFGIAQAGVHASKLIHQNMVNRILRVPISYFDTVPVGRIINRFSSDQNNIDSALPTTLGNAIFTTLSVIAVIFVIASVTPIFMVVLLSLSFLYQYAQRYYLRSSREIQRLVTISRSPIYALFGETLNGLSTIRAYQKTGEFSDENARRIQKNNQANYASLTSFRWLSVRLEFFGTAVIFSSTFFAILARDTIDPGLAGLSMTYALRLTQTLNQLVRMSTDVENNLVSVERCVQMTDIKMEAPFDMEYRPPAHWPDQGMISFDKLTLRYRPNLPLVLKGVTANIRPQEKIGVVGRTGAGKSSLMLALFRIVEAEGGSIVIDGEDISRLGLHQLRSKIAIIPQDPILFCGTVRSNLDPFEVYTDEELWGALEAVEMKKQVMIMESQLESPITEYGENLSHGMRQLLCLARAILKKSKILVMDEATANVDFETDVLIQKAIRKAFEKVTVLTIAHRLSTIIDSDRVMVFHEGRLVEFDTPENLLKNDNSVFYGLAKEAGLQGLKDTRLGGEEKEKLVSIDT